DWRAYAPSSSSVIAGESPGVWFGDEYISPSWVCRIIRRDWRIAQRQESFQLPSALKIRLTHFPSRNKSQQKPAICSQEKGPGCSVAARFASDSFNQETFLRS